MLTYQKAYSEAQQEVKRLTAENARLTRIINGGIGVLHKAAHPYEPESEVDFGSAR